MRITGSTVDSTDSLMPKRGMAPMDQITATSTASRDSAVAVIRRKGMKMTITTTIVTRGMSSSRSAFMASLIVAVITGMPVTYTSARPSNISWARSRIWKKLPVTSCPPPSSAATVKGTRIWVAEKSSEKRERSYRSHERSRRLSSAISSGLPLKSSATRGSTRIDSPSPVI